MEWDEVLWSVKMGATAALSYGVSLLGGWSLPLRALLLLMVLDYIGGVMQAAVERRISSSVGFRGIAKKAYYLILIGAVYALEQAIEPEFVYGHTVLTVFLAVNELISIVEHGVVLGVAIPQGLTQLLAKLLGKYGGDQGGDGSG